MLTNISASLLPGVEDPQPGHNHEQIHDRLCGSPQLKSTDAPSSHHSICPTLCTTKCISAHACEYWQCLAVYFLGLLPLFDRTAEEQTGRGWHTAKGHRQDLNWQTTGPPHLGSFNRKVVVFLHFLLCHVVACHLRSEPPCLWWQLGGDPKQENHQSGERSGGQQAGQQLQGKTSEGKCFIT